MVKQESCLAALRLIKAIVLRSMRMEHAQSVRLAAAFALPHGAPNRPQANAVAALKQAAKSRSYLRIPKLNAWLHFLHQEGLEKAGD
jgi:hypothetical protein